MKVFKLNDSEVLQFLYINYFKKLTLFAKAVGKQRRCSITYLRCCHRIILPFVLNVELCS